MEVGADVEQIVTAEAQCSLALAVLNIDCAAMLEQPPARQKVRKSTDCAV